MADILGHLPQRRITCLEHPGGPFVIQPGVEPVVETECVMCCFTRQEKESAEHYRRSTAWTRKPAQTPEEIAEAPDPFRGFRKGE